MRLLRPPAAVRIAAVLLLGSVQAVPAQQPVPPGAASVASGITPARYSIPAPGKGRLTASVPPLPPKPPPPLELPPGDAAMPAAPMLPAVAKVSPYQPPIFWPPVPRRKPGGTAAAAPPAAASPAAAPPPPVRDGYTAVVPISVFGPDDAHAAPGTAAEPTLEELAGTEPIVFTVRLPTVVLPEPAP